MSERCKINSVQYEFINKTYFYEQCIGLIENQSLCVRHSVQDKNLQRAEPEKQESIQSIWLSKVKPVAT